MSSDERICGRSLILWKEVLQMEEMWFLRERSGSKITPKFLHEVEGVKLLPQKDTEEFEETVTLERCCGVPISRYSVLDGLTVRRLFVSQVCTASSIEEMEAREFMESDG